ncbi:MAG TPA: AmmeMemoRadiSam system protein A [Blastocatellia bacterium]|nr:AmmeMemoRadiSam system protein A [Blastocatellia bacterium]
MSPANFSFFNFQFRLFLMDIPPNDILPQRLARLTVETLVRETVIIKPPNEPKGVLATLAGVFVTLRTLDDQLRGCIGTIEPACANVAEEIIQNAISAATRDPRFLPVASAELAFLNYGVDVLAAPEPARGPEDLDPSTYGVIVGTVDGLRRGLLLPRIEGIDSVEEQWLAVHQKAGIKPGTKVLVERFTVTRFGKD